MSDTRFPVKMAGRVPVVETPEEIDITNAGQFREALLACTARGAAIISRQSRDARNHGRIHDQDSDY